MTAVVLICCSDVMDILTVRTGQMNFTAKVRHCQHQNIIIYVCQAYTRLNHRTRVSPTTLLVQVGLVQSISCVYRLQNDGVGYVCQCK